MQKKKIVILFIVLVILAVGFILFSKACLPSGFAKRRIESELEKKYGVSFEVKKIDEESLFSKSDSVRGFTACSNDGIFLAGECNRTGSVISESYIHYYYAEVLNDEIKNIIGKCFDDCYIVRDCVGFTGNEAIVDLVETNTIKESKDYISHIDRENTYFRVYVRDSVSDEELQDALDRLQDEDFCGNIYFMPVQEELFDELKSSGMQCYFAKSSASEKVAENVKCLDKEEIDKLIYQPFEYTKAQYLSKYNKAEILQ